MIILIGPPASGKSTFTKNFLIPFGYVHINRDTLLTQQKCIEATREALINQGRSVVIDNTNPDRESRAVFIDCARAYNIPIRCFVLKTDMNLAKHLNEFRAVSNHSNHEV